MHDDDKTITILAISGSLRKKSTNTTLLKACALLAPENTTITLYSDLHLLPLFNPDIEGDKYDKPAPKAVVDFRKQLKQADGVLIASPEYAHGITGAMKNALDWTVASGEFVGKPVTLFNASPRATHALNALKEVISVMDAQLIESAFTTVQILGSNLNETDIATHEDISNTLTKSLKCFKKALI